MLDPIENEVAPPEVEAIPNRSKYSHTKGCEPVPINSRFYCVSIELNPNSDYTISDCYENSAENAGKNCMPLQSICCAGIVILEF